MKNIFGSYVCDKLLVLLAVWKQRYTGLLLSIFPIVAIAKFFLFSRVEVEILLKLKYNTCDTMHMIKTGWLRDFKFMRLLVGPPIKSYIRYIML